MFLLFWYKCENRKRSICWENWSDKQNLSALLKQFIHFITSILSSTVVTWRGKTHVFVVKVSLSKMFPCAEGCDGIGLFTSVGGASVLLLCWRTTSTGEADGCWGSSLLYLHPADESSPAFRWVQVQVHLRSFQGQRSQSESELCFRSVSYALTVEESVHLTAGRRPGCPRFCFWLHLERSSSPAQHRYILR